MDEAEPTSRLNRREVIRKGAIVLGAAWTIPIIQTIPANAEAVGSQPPCRSNGRDCTDNSQCCSLFCDPSSHQCGPNPCLPFGSTCTDNNQCCSGNCVINVITGTGICIF